jgi:hypothetical protein
MDGKRADRPELEKQKAKLVIAKLDRLELIRSRVELAGRTL